MIFFTILIVLITIVLTAVYHRYSRSGRLINKIPGPKAWPIIGNIHNYSLSAENLFKYQRSLSKLYGDVNQIHGLNRRFVHISNPKDIEKILSSTQYNYKEHPYTYISGWLGEGLLLSNGKKWHQRRKMLTKSFHFNILKKFMTTFVDQTEDFIKRLEPEVDQKMTDLLPLVSNATLRIMCETAMGISTRDQSILSKMDAYIKSVRTIGDIFSYRLARAWLHFDNVFQLTSIGKLQNFTVSDLHEFTNGVIKERRNYLDQNLNLFDEDVESYDATQKLAMLDLLIKNEKTGNINIDGIREEVDTFMFEGHDTTAVALTFMIMAIANEPDIQDKIYEELYQIFGDSDRLPTMDDLNEMKYLECCIKESIRLYPSVVVIMRCLTKDTILGVVTQYQRILLVLFVSTMFTIAPICILTLSVLSQKGSYQKTAANVTHTHIFPLALVLGTVLEPLGEPSNTDLHKDLELETLRAHYKASAKRFFDKALRHSNPLLVEAATFDVKSYNTALRQKFALLEMKVVMSRLLRKFRLEPVTKPSDVVYKTDIVLSSTHPIYARFCLRK